MLASLVNHTEQTEKLKKKRTKNRSRSMIRTAISVYATCILRPRYSEFLSEYCHAVWYGKTRMVWCGYPTVKKSWRYIFIRFDRSHGRDARTDRHRV